MSEAQARISSREFTEWIAYYGLEPWGEEPADARHGILASLIANSNRDASKHTQPYKPEDFMISKRLAAAQISSDDDTPHWMAQRDRFKALARRRS